MEGKCHKYEEMKFEETSPNQTPALLIYVRPVGGFDDPFHVKPGALTDSYSRLGVPNPKFEKILPPYNPPNPKELKVTRK